MYIQTEVRSSSARAIFKKIKTPLFTIAFMVAVTSLICCYVAIVVICNLIRVFITTGLFVLFISSFILGFNLILESTLNDSILSIIIIKTTTG